MSSNRDGFGEDGIHRVTGTAFGPDGYDMVGCDKNGCMRHGIDAYRNEMESFD